MRRLSFLVIVAALALLPVLWPDPYLLSVVAAAGIMIIAAISLNLLLGFTGQLSLGHAAFLALAPIPVRCSPWASTSIWASHRLW